MKKFIGNLGKIMLVFLITLVSFTGIVKAATIAKNDIPGYEGKSVYKNTWFKGGTQTSALEKNPFITVNGHVAYCVEFGQPLDIEYGSSKSGFEPTNIANYKGTEYSRFNVNMTSEIIDKISLIAYYGYGYEGHNGGKYYLATQAMILETIYADSNKAITTGEGRDYIDHITWTVNDVYPNGEVIDIDNERNTINNLVNSYYTKPDFGSTNISLEKGESTTLTDNNNVLSNYSVNYTDTKIDVKVNGNTITIKALENTTADITFIKEAVSTDDENLVYTKNGAVTSNQKIATFGHIEQVKTKIGVNVYEEGKGNFELIKTDTSGNNNLSGAKFKFGTNLNGTENVDWNYYITGDNGLISIDNLEEGTYYYQEVEAPRGYLINDDTVKSTVIESGKTTSVTMSNKQIIGSLEFSKTDFSTSAPLPNTKISIYTENDVLVFEGITDENGMIKIDNLPYGKYYILETEAPAGYVLNEEKMYFEILEDGQIVKATMTNTQIPTNPKTADTNIIFFSIITLISGGCSIYWYKKQALSKIR